MLRYHDSGREKTCAPSVGQWNMINKKMVNGGTIDNWASLSFSRKHPEEVQWFCSDQIQMCNATGMAFYPRSLVDISSATPNNIENALRDVHRRTTEMIAKQGKGNQLELLIVILPEVSGSYGKIKKVCETDHVSQCCLPRHACRPNQQYLENVALKINVKVGGRNTVLGRAFVRNGIPFVSEVPTIIFDADVTHPPPGEDSASSIVAVVALMDWPEITKYRGLVSSQPYRQEIIEDLFNVIKDPQRETTVNGGMIRELLIAFCRKTGRRPERIIFYRDGVSEGQFSHVLLHEVDAIQKACASLEEGHLPPVTFVVVQKMHHTVLFPEVYGRRDMTDKSGNILPGTVVDHMICHPTDYDFCDPCSCRQAVVSGEKLIEPEEMMQVEIVFPYKSIKTSVKREDTVKSLLLAVEDQGFWDSYYTCETRILDQDTRIADLNLSSGSRISVHPRLRGGKNGAGSSRSNLGGGRVTITVTRVPLYRYIRDLKRDQDWFEIVDVPESLRNANRDSFVVMLGKDGRETLRLILDCLEMVHKRKKCFRGGFEERDIFYIVELGVFRISVDMHEIDHNGFKLDMNKIAETVNNHFRYEDKRETLKCHPMYVKELTTEINMSSLDPEYFSNIKKRSLIFNNPVTMSSPRRVQIYTALIRHWKALQGVNKDNFAEALDPGVTTQREKIEELHWSDEISVEATVLSARLNYHQKVYWPTYYSRLDYSRCVFEHGPSDKEADCGQVTEKQCEAALYLLWPTQLTEVQKRLIIDYVETSTSAASVPQPPSGRSGSSLVRGVRVANTIDVVQLFSKN